ncbi:MAG: glycosyltransferase family 87 protein [Nevskia sp.]|nr:glycosyltransferase family 87 protein [Nevskia sp.]
MVWVGMSHHGVDYRHSPIGNDFITYWAASHLALSGTPATAYDLVSIVRVERAVIPGIHTINPWVYPPTFYLLILPLALLPYYLSYCTFIVLTFAPYFSMVRRIFAEPGSLILLLSFPGVFVNALQGQNGFLTGALIGWALLLLPRRPAWGGALIGLLTIKPQLGLLLPLALLCGRQWRALLYASLSSALLLALSVALLGTDSLFAFFGIVGRFSDWFTHDVDLLVKIPSFFSFACLLGAPRWVAYALHGVIAAGVAAAVGWVWLRRSAQHDLRAALLVTGSLLASPYLLDYDLAWLALPIAWLGRQGMRHGWLRWEREMLVAVWLLPMMLIPLHAVTHLQLAPFVLLGFFLVVLRRCALDTESAAEATASAEVI